MYKLLIVDDKDDIIQGIRRYGKWEDYGVEIAGWARDGVEALQVAAAVDPDLVITDIKMPRLDGIRLTALLKESKPALKVIILSGYDEFSHAQQAVKLGAEEYLLKPVPIAELEASVQRVVAKLDRETAQRAAEAELLEKLALSLPLLREKFLQQLLTGPSPDAELLVEKLRFLQIDPELVNGFGLIVMEIDQFRGVRDPDSYRLLEEFKTLTESWTRRPETAAPVWICADPKERLVLLVQLPPGMAPEDSKKSLLRIAETLRESLPVALNRTVSLGIGRYCPALARLSQAYQEALEALTHKFALGPQQLIHIDDISPCGARLNFYYPIAIEKDLFSAVKIGATDEAERHLAAFFTDLERYGAIYPRLVRKSLQGLVFSLSRLLMELNLEQTLPDPNDVLNTTTGFDTLEELQQWIRELIAQIFAAQGMEKSLKTHSKMERAKEYIETHLTEAISLNSVADHMCLSPTYFSALFKKYCDSSFQDYLIQRRIEKAKQLLAQGELRVYEVADRVGYSDPRYFSELFRKHVGVNPAKYRKA